MLDHDIFADFDPSYPLVMSAAGLLKFLTRDNLKPLLGADFNVAGSITPGAKRAGNPGVAHEYYGNPLYSVNNWGMNNDGSDVVEQQDLEALAAQVILSIAGFKPEDYSLLYRQLAHLGVGAELNFGCPNVAGHKIVSFSPDDLAENLAAVKPEHKARPTAVGVKLSPYTDPGLIKEVAAVVNEAGFVYYVATHNTIPLGRVWTVDFRDAIRTGEDNAGHNGGIGGEALKPLSLMNAEQFRLALNRNIHVIRVGGVSTGRDLQESYEVGATGVQINTAFVHNPHVFTTIKQEYADIVG